MNIIIPVTQGTPPFSYGSDFIIYLKDLNF